MALNGFNRRHDLPVLERCLAPGAEDTARLKAGGWQSRLDRLVETVAGVSPAGLDANGVDGPEEAALRLARTTVTLQRAAGFGVERAGRLPGPRPDWIRFFAEFDLEEAGVAAAELAGEMLQAALGDRAPEPEEKGFAARFAALRDSAADALPADTRALIDAARARDIPFYRMDRAPYNPIRGRFRIRPNGLLRLGQASFQRTLDGTFCVERSAHLHSMALDRAAMIRRAASTGVDIAWAAGSEPRACGSSMRALRAARGFEFPVVLKTARRVPGGVSPKLGDEAAVEAMAHRLLGMDSELIVERWISGRRLELVYIGGRRFAALDRHARERPAPVAPEAIPAGLAEPADRLAERFELAAMSIEVRLAEDGRPWIVDIDPAPRLDRLLDGESHRLAEAADRILAWLFPDGAATRVPLVAVTGTNGKTTTAWLLERILSESGRRTGLACSTGAYLCGDELDSFESGALTGHLAVLDHPGVETAVLETTRGAAITTGIGFDRCDVAVGLNVTNDHLDVDLGVGTVEAMAGVKRWIVERGRRVVLNADDEHCRAMAERLTDRRPVLVSCDPGKSRIDDRAAAGATTVSCREFDGRAWITIRENEHDRRLIAVDEVPLTQAGRARHNLSNVLHAAAAAHLLGVDDATIANALAATNAQTLPGRLSHFDAGRFRIVLDYAHNPAGLRCLVDYCEGFEVAGRRTIALSLPVDRGEDFVIEGAAAVAGRFDHYICKSYRILYGREPHEVPELLRKGLIRAGVQAERITMIGDEDRAIAHALASAGPGDLVVLAVGKHFREHIAAIEAFISDAGRG